MDIWFTLLPWLIPMLFLMGMSAFFSASEAALFYLTSADRRKMVAGGEGERTALKLLEDADRLLTAILFWNLLINVAYFSLASICSLRLERSEQGSGTQVFIFAVTALLGLIFFSEMLPKSVAVIAPRRIAGTFALPLALAVRLVDPLMPGLSWVNKISTRMIWPNFKPESAIEIQDLEQAILLSTGDEALIRQEQAVLKNIVQLSAIKVEEWMRPRNQLAIYSPPVKLEDLKETVPKGGYLLISEPDTQEIEKAIRLDNQYEFPEECLEKLAEPVLYLPWCATVATALEKMSHRDREVTVVVNEYGETIGVLTIEDILETIFTYSPSRTRRLLDLEPVQELGPDKWLVLGLTNLRLLTRRLNLELPETTSVTVGGVIQEELQRLAEKGDVVHWGPCRFEVREADRRGSLLVELQVCPPVEEE
jgi:putative hemolysin